MQDQRYLYCEWCLRILHRIRPGNHEHHVFGRHNPVTIRLCHEHHMQTYHSEGKITRQDIIDKILVPFCWDGVDKSATFARVPEARRLPENSK